ncbi:hypothetical protein BDV27DRAFT_135934 [Aspergillus caelatus]|uniref:Uncharacterized protein n=1 Tax=Aspergillus caelatus TaxID=61420 RepID=A0A5N6ZPG5_9EURO|nr:uncharacterized protein BDV27DRAFT_135934 [Aspergillus caelatus]KAE8359514.1 hypothetical protein BDV27DRAFT_135934 [Aspergillus caelatus]
MTNDPRIQLPASSMDLNGPLDNLGIAYDADDDNKLPICSAAPLQCSLPSGVLEHQMSPHRTGGVNLLHCVWWPRTSPKILGKCELDLLICCTPMVPDYSQLHHDERIGCDRGY